MFTYTITIAPKGSFLFRIEGIESLAKVKFIAGDLAKVYGRNAMHVSKWSAPMGSGIELDEVLPVETNAKDLDDREVVECVERESGRMAVTFKCGDIVLVSQRFNVLHVIKGDKQNWHQSAIEQWAINKGYVITKGL